MMAAGPVAPTSFTNPGVLRLDGVVDATPQRVVLADNAALNPVTNFTVAAWVQRNTADINTSSTLYDAGSNAGTWYVGFLADNRLTLTTDGVSDFPTSLLVTDTNYHHVVFTKSGGILFAFLDGIPSVGVGVPLAMPAPSGNKLVGGKTSNTTAPFGGLVDDLRLYNHALSVVEVVTGTQAKKVIVRGIGPSLPITGVLADPLLELHDSTGATIASNDNWVDSPNTQAIIDTTIPRLMTRSLRFSLTLDPGAYTAIVRGVNDTTGIALIEVYDLASAVDSKLANISTRGFVQTGDDVMIGGLIIFSDTSKNVIVRADEYHPCPWPALWPILS